MTKVFVAAGEASGDLHAAAVIRELEVRSAGLEVFGLGGELLREQGADLLYDVRDLAVAGFWEVAKRILHFRRIFKATLAAIDSERPRLAILVDYPGMNLRLAAELKRRAIPVVYYIVPQVWAWKPGRIQQIEANVDLLLSILPFEKELFDPARVRCEFVGHPLLDHVSDSGDGGEFRARHQVAVDAPLIALLPGSRQTEVTQHYPIMLDAMKLLAAEFPNLRAMTAVRAELPAESYAGPERAAGIAPQHVTDQRYELLRSAAVAIVSSGTATLEAALCGRPFCVVYRTGWLTYQIARRVIRLRQVGLVNIVAGKPIVPEYLQNEMTPANLAAFCRRMISDRHEAEQVATALKSVRAKLGEPGASKRAAALIAEAYCR